MKTWDRIERRLTPRDAPRAQMAMFFVSMFAITAATALMVHHVPAAVETAGQLSASVVSAVPF